MSYAQKFLLAVTLVLVAAACVEWHVDANQPPSSSDGPRFLDADKPANLAERGSKQIAENGTSDSPSLRSPDHVALAQQAFEQGNLPLAKHHCLVLVSARRQVADAVELLFQICSEQLQQEIDSVQPKDRISIRDRFDEAKRLTDEAESLVYQLLNDDVASDYLSQAERARIYETLRVCQTQISKLETQRQKSFHAFAWVHIEKAKENYRAGKGTWSWKVWNWNDSEQAFVSAVVQLNLASSVLDELSSSDRTTIADWQSKLKSELNEAEYEQANQMARIIVGSSQDRSHEKGLLKNQELSHVSYSSY